MGKDDEESEQSPGESDAEAEAEAVRECISEIDELVAQLTRKLDDLSSRSAKHRKLNVPINLLLRAKQLTKNPEADFASSAEAEATSDNAATSQIEANVATSHGPPVPQANAFREAQGYSSFDDIRDGQTLIDCCCTESRNRTCRHL